MYEDYMLIARYFTLVKHVQLHVSPLHQRKSMFLHLSFKSTGVLPVKASALLSRISLQLPTPYLHVKQTERGTYSNSNNNKKN
uniref:Uncharacterized protein n=1 Tax=Zea mays TaxID=4577 RepID=C0PJU2_MAIZE|nr:unknown [Zea mays]